MRSVPGGRVATTSSPTAAVIDASAVVALCSAEPGRDAVVRDFLDEAAAAPRPVHAPGLIGGECPHVLCKRRERGDLDAAGYTTAVAALDRTLRLLLPPPGGDTGLALPAERLAAGYTCNKVNDSFYLALAEQLATAGAGVEVATFDDDQAKRADRRPGVCGRRLPDS